MAESPVAPFASLSLANQRPFFAIGLGGLLVGVLDLLYATLVYSPHRPILIPQTIASGVLGTTSYQGGTVSTALGTVLHSVISFGAAIVYYLASRKLKLLIRRAVLFGMLYGAAVYFLHASDRPTALRCAVRSHSPDHAIPEFVEHWFFVGLPASLSVRHYSLGCLPNGDEANHHWT